MPLERNSLENMQKKLAKQHLWRNITFGLIIFVIFAVILITGILVYDTIKDKFTSNNKEIYNK